MAGMLKNTYVDKFWFKSIATLAMWLAENVTEVFLRAPA